MSVKVMGMVWDMRLDPSLKLVLLAFADHANHEGKQIYPSIELIARKTGYSKRHTQRITAQLRDEGLLVPVSFAEGGRGHAVLYRIPIKGDKLTPIKKDDGDDAERTTSKTEKDDTPVTPTVSKPSTEPSIKRKNQFPEPQEVYLNTDIPMKFQTEIFNDIWMEYLNHRWDMKKPMTMRGAQMAMGKLSSYTVDVAISALRDSIANGWQGIFPDKAKSAKTFSQMQRDGTRQAVEEYFNNEYGQKETD